MRKYFAIAAFFCIATGLNSRQVIDMLKASVEQHRAGAEPNDELLKQRGTESLVDPFPKAGALPEPL